MYFNNITSLEDLKSAYKALVIKHHPDMGGDTRTMQEINAEHDSLFEQLKRSQNINAENGTAKATTETPEEFRDIMAKLIILENIDIELCGSWLWISGDTRPVKDELKAAGCRWSRTKKIWYWRHEEQGAHWSRGKASMADIRTKYGSSKLTYNERLAMTA